VIQEVDTSLRVFREQIPLIFTYRTGHDCNSSGSISPDGYIEPYDSFNDPWFILLHANLYTAEMMMWKEMTHYEAGAYDRAVGCARAMVVFIRHMRPEHWVHVGMSPSNIRKSILITRHDGGVGRFTLFQILVQGIRTTTPPRRPRSSSKCMRRS
jgi:hypothetical protein